MLDGLFSFFETLINLVTGLVNFLISFFMDIVYVINLATTFVVRIPTLFSFMPTECITILTIIFGIVVTYKVLGREG